MLFRLRGTPKTVGDCRIMRQIMAVPRAKQCHAVCHGSRLYKRFCETKVINRCSPCSIQHRDVGIAFFRIDPVRQCRSAAISPNVDDPLATLPRLFLLSTDDTLESWQHKSENPKPANRQCLAAGDVATDRTERRRGFGGEVMLRWRTHQGHCCGCTRSMENRKEGIVVEVETDAVCRRGLMFFLIDRSAIACRTSFAAATYPLPFQAIRRRKRRRHRVL